MKRNVIILGAGLVGSLLAVLLRKKGYDVTIYEHRPDMRKATISAGKSINLAMSNRGWKAIELAGLRSAIEAIAIPMHGRYLHQLDGQHQFQAYGKNDEAIYSVSRGDLNKKLMDLAEEHGAVIQFNERSIDIDVKKNQITLLNADQITTTIQADLLIGADGAFSSLRKAYAAMDRVNFSQYFIEAGYKELYMPPGNNNEWAIEKHALHIWPRGKYMMIALPNVDGSFTCTLFFPFEGEPSFESVNTKSEIRDFFNEHFKDAVALMPTLIDDYINNPVASLITTRIDPWYFQDKSFLIGDAAHAIVPFYGQGMNAGFEDCTILMELIDLYQDDWSAIMPAYHKKRKENGDAVGALALMNFDEMKDKVADQVFLERKKIEKDLGVRYPDQFNSVYEMVSFTHTPYAHAWAATQAQDALLQRIMQEGNYFELINNTPFQKKLDIWMNEYELSLKGVIAKLHS